MEFDHESVRRVEEEDRFSRLPDELIHKILSCFDMKFAVQTCSLSSRWEFVWKSMPCLNFSSRQFCTLPKFSKFVTNVLTHRNHQIEVSSVDLHFHGSADQGFVRKIANYVFSHNVQQMRVVCCPKTHRKFHPSLFSSQSLQHFTLSYSHIPLSPCITPKTPWDFPVLTTLHLSHITLCTTRTKKPFDIFSKCVNLKSLILQTFSVEDVEVFDIITPRLSNLVLIHGKGSIVINLIAPQLENLTVIDCSIKYLNAPSGLSSFFYGGYCPGQLYKDGLHSLNKASIHLPMTTPYTLYEEEDVLKTINMLQQLCTVRYLTLSFDIIQCLSAFPDIVSHHPSPFSNLICLIIDSSMKRFGCVAEISTEARNFFLESSPSATIIMKLPEKLRSTTQGGYCDISDLVREYKEARSFQKLLTDYKTYISSCLDVFGRKPPLPSQIPSSSSTSILTPSTSNINFMMIKTISEALKLEELDEDA